MRRDTDLLLGTGNAHNAELTADIYDLIVIGAGPAGMMAAISAAKNGKEVLLLEKNSSLGRKLLATGNGRCNLGNSELSATNLVAIYGPNGRFLRPALQTFGPAQTVDFFESQGVAIKTEQNGHLFPVSGRAAAILKALEDLLTSSGVRIMRGVAVKKLTTDHNAVSELTLTDNRKLHAHNYLIACGGLAAPRLGSSGDGLAWAQALGHKIVTPQPALVPIQVAEKWITKAQGVTLAETTISIYCGNKRKFSASGGLIFTHLGLSGPLILNISGKIGKLLLKGSVTASLDLVPDSAQQLDAMLQKALQAHPHKQLKNYLSQHIPPKLSVLVLELCNIAPHQLLGAVTRAERSSLVKQLKGLELQITQLDDFAKAMVTAGGVSLKEIDPRSMRSRKLDNLYFAGEVLDLDGPCGGYNLQICWSTGYLAGLLK